MSIKLFNTITDAITNKTIKVIFINIMNILWVYVIFKVILLIINYSDAALIKAENDSSGNPGLLLNSGWNCTPR